MDPNPVPSSPLLSGQEPISNASSICSRKDSGIKSNSRRSSIQQQVLFFVKLIYFLEYLLSLSKLLHRVLLTAL